MNKTEYVYGNHSDDVDDDGDGVDGDDAVSI